MQTRTLGRNRAIAHAALVSVLIEVECTLLQAFRDDGKFEHSKETKPARVTYAQCKFAMNHMHASLKICKNTIEHNVIGYDCLRF